MNEAKFVEFMRKLGGSPEMMKKVEKLVQLSAQAMTLIKKVNATAPEAREKFREELAKVHEALNVEYQAMLSELGYTHESLQAYVEDPANFSPEGWKLAQNVKEQFLEEVNTPPEKELKSRKSSKQRKAWLSA